MRWLLCRVAVAASWLSGCERMRRLWASPAVGLAGTDWQRQRATAAWQLVDSQSLRRPAAMLLLLHCSVSGLGAVEGQTGRVAGWLAEQQEKRKKQNKNPKKELRVSGFEPSTPSLLVTVFTSVISWRAGESKGEGEGLYASGRGSGWRQPAAVRSSGPSPRASARSAVQCSAVQCIAVLCVIRRGASLQCDEVRLDSAVQSACLAAPS